MLKLLHIENIAVIECCDIEFDCGFNILTGETGAGKSIIIDAIGAVLGERTSRELVRTGENKAVVSAVFDELSEESTAWLVENSLYDEESELVIQREIHADGKSMCRANGRPITATMLKELGSTLINIHGQHDDKLLLDSNRHADFIDRFAYTPEYSKVYEGYTQAYSQLIQKTREMSSLNMDEAEKERRISMLKFQIAEIEDADIKPGEDEEISEKRKILQNSSRILDAISYAYALFSGNELKTGIRDSIFEAANALSNVSNTATSMTGLFERVNELGYMGDEISSELKNLLEQFEFSAKETDYTEARFDTIQKLKRKYGAAIEDVFEFLENAKNELDSVEFSEEMLIRLKKETDELKVTTQTLADKLYILRKAAARSFEKRISSELSSLDMGKVTFSVDITRRESLDIRGGDEVCFLISTNIGEPLKQLHKIASGGELARIMLAVKNVLAEHDMVNTLIFDEVDSGISGRAAQKVAEKLSQLSKYKQIMCVTHLAQTSAMADVHFIISKSERNNRTFTQVNRLDDEGRVAELARITGGTKITDTTLQNARELIADAQNLKNQSELALQIERKR